MVKRRTYKYGNFETPHFGELWKKFREDLNKGVTSFSFEAYDRPKESKPTAKKAKASKKSEEPKA
jgi:hypothetical protein